jgi:hypothetical protein
MFGTVMLRDAKMFFDLASIKTNAKIMHTAPGEATLEDA